ncbi:hypothetical protein BDV96DRAFT_647489 [Lophiotrema nucula]|uniref:Uncharacterized protein n=1 Tax=Lophiotrema nucula TaxID=690887 RepID=A0A6A5Z6M7_9PLEO|nr:hypothetical protein BDV96DRAFT_647489 [Lophiotrema nucula]
MGVPTPNESAPSYDELFHDHPVNGHTPSGSTSSYMQVSQDDVELAHNHTSPSPAPAEQESLAQTIAGVFRPKPHTHCEQCDVQTAAREKREAQQTCRALVAATFMVAFICLMILGITVAKATAPTRKGHHD